MSDLPGHRARQSDGGEFGAAPTGTADAGEKLQPEEIILRKASGKESHLTVQLTEGKNREIRRMFSALSHEVTRLKRVAYGALELGELESGKFRELSRVELERAFPGLKK